MQTFPDDYHFCGPRRKIASQIGNAVPPLWAERIGEAAMRTLLSLPPLSVIFRPPSLPLSYPFPTEKRI
ncbi:MAG: DNA cytosine methyltransferase [Thermoproteota archaeon]